MKKTQKLLLSAIFLSLGVALPFLTANIKELGDSLLPMHLTTFVCSIFCGPWYGLAVGFLTPFLKSLISAMPPIYPNAVWMALELAAYGGVFGLLYNAFGKKGILRLYASLIISMLAGRTVWGIAKAVLLGVGGNSFTLTAFITGGFVDSALGIVIQLILIPLIVKITKKKMP